MSSSVGDIVSPQLSSFLFAFHIEIFTSKHFFKFFLEKEVCYLIFWSTYMKDKNQIHFIHFVFY